MGLQATRDHYSRFYNGFTMWLHSFISAFFVIQRVGGTLTPSGSVSIDCGGQQTFTCAVPGLAGWTITGLTGISSAIGGTPASVVASARVTANSTALTPTSTITITGFSTNDNRGTVQCVDISGVPTVQGVATLAVVTLASATAVMANVDQCSTTLTWSEPSDSSATTSVSCTPPSPQCSSCTSSGCTIGGLTPSTSYTFSVTRRRSGCDDSTAVSSAVMSGGVPSCPTNVLVTDRSSDFSSATITWEQPTNSPLVTFYDVTCNSSCTAMPCTSGSSTCRVLGVSPCEDYSVTVLPMNSCGSSTGCTENSVVPVPSQGPPSCPANVASVAHDDNNTVTVTWSLAPTSPPVTSTTVTYCPTSSPNCGDGQVCTSPCTVRRLTPNTEYRFTVTPANNCGSPSCTGSTATAKTACICPVCSASVTPAILSGVVPSVVLILINIISVVVAVLVTRHCDKKSAKGDSSSRREELYEQVEGKKVYEDINMTDSPAYGPVI